MNHPTDDGQAGKLRQEAAAIASEAGERGGDPACWLRRVCQQCGSMADEDPPTTCPVCHAAMPGE
jgi:rubrerythrin